MEDIKLLHLTPDKFSRTSDYFDVCLKAAEKLIREGNAFCDDTPMDAVKELREKREPSAKRDLSTFIVFKCLCRCQEWEKGNLFIFVWKG